MATKKIDKWSWSSEDWYNSGAREAAFQSWLIRELEKYSKKSGKAMYLVKTMLSNKAGVPDILLCVKGRFVGMELKSYKGVVKIAQTTNIKWIKSAGGVAGVVRCWSDAVDLLAEAGYHLEAASK